MIIIMVLQFPISGDDGDNNADDDDDVPEAGTTPPDCVDVAASS